MRDQPLTATPCKDCRAEGIVTNRPANNPGPRCTTHHRAKIKADRARSRARRLEKVYTLTEDEYQTLYRAQGGRCYACRRATGKTKRLAVDHDHDTGEVRGLLCGPCNKTLGHARDSVEFFVRFAEYLGWSKNSQPTFASRVLGRRVYVGTAPVKEKR